MQDIAPPSSSTFYFPSFFPASKKKKKGFCFFPTPTAFQWPRSVFSIYFVLFDHIQNVLVGIAMPLSKIIWRGPVRDKQKLLRESGGHFLIFLPILITDMTVRGQSWFCSVRLMCGWKSHIRNSGAKDPENLNPDESAELHHASRNVRKIHIGNKMKPRLFSTCSVARNSTECNLFTF